jgi:hypothetical protein
MRRLNDTTLMGIGIGDHARSEPLRYLQHRGTVSRITSPIVAVRPSATQ